MSRSMILGAAACLTLLAGTSMRAAAQGNARQLVCRGKPHIDIRVDRNPSPRNASLVAMVLRYARSTKIPGTDYKNLDPGACTWNPAGWASEPPEPGVVYFDLLPLNQNWFGPGSRRIDTTITAAEHSPDTISVPRYFNDPTKLWRFFVDDVSHFSSSNGPLNHGTPTWVELHDPPPPAEMELRCRGGAGLAFSPGGAAGTNLVSMTLTYAKSANGAGQTGRGLVAGSCAWEDRSRMPGEPGRVRFITASNAQLRQAQSGAAVDRSPNAAERFPDATTIPVYMADTARYWTFTIASSRTDTAKAHGAWKPSVTSTLAGPLSKAGSPKSQAAGFGGTRTPGVAKSGVGSAVTAPLRLEGVTRVLDRFAIEFSARPNASPDVRYSTDRPVREPSTGRLFFPGAAVQGSGAMLGGFAATIASGPTRGFRARYTASTRLTPERGRTYHYIITVPAGVGVKEEQYAGQLTAVSQGVRITITSVDILKSTVKTTQHKLVAWADSSQRFVHCALGSCSNVGDQLRLVVYAEPTSDIALGGRVPGWDSGPGKDTGFGRMAFDLSTIRDDRPLKSFTLHSMPGDITFIAYGTIEVIRR